MKVNIWEGSKTITINEIIKVLNDAFTLDPAAVQDLISTRFPCNQKLRDHETIQVHAYGDSSMNNPKVGFLGMLNGLIGIDQNGSGAIAAKYNDDKELTGFVMTDTDAVTASSYKVKKIRGGQISSYKDSIYEYEIESKMPAEKVESYCREVVRRCVHKSQGGCFTGSCKFPFGLERYYKFTTLDKGRYNYTVCEPFTG